MKLGTALDVILGTVVDYLENHNGDAEAIEDILGDQRGPQLEFIASLETLGHTELAEDLRETLDL